MTDLEQLRNIFAFELEKAKKGSADARDMGWHGMADTLDTRRSTWQIALNYVDDKINGK